MCEAEEKPSSDAAAGVKRPADDAAAACDTKRATPTQKPHEQQDGAAAGDDETIEIRVVVGKLQQTVTRALDSTVAELKRDIESQTGIPADARMKLLFKGQLKDEQTLRQTGLKNGSKLMVVGSKPDAAAASAAAASSGAQTEWDTAPKKEMWAEQAQHKKVLEKGRPDDGWPGIKGKQIPLRDDQTYIPGLLNAQGTRVRLTFKPEIGQVWVAAPTHTQKISVASIAKIEAQPIPDREEYSILRVQLGAAGEDVPPPKVLQPAAFGLCRVQR